MEEDLRAAVEEEAGLQHVTTGRTPSGYDVHPRVKLVNATHVEITDKAAAAAWLINHEREDLLEIKTSGKDTNKKSITTYFAALRKARLTPPGIVVEERIQAKFDSHGRWNYADVMPEKITPQDMLDGYRKLESEKSE